MTTSTKKLALIFHDADNKARSLPINTFDSALTAERVATGMEKLAALPIIQYKNINKFVVPIEAVVTETIKEVLYKKES